MKHEIVRHRHELRRRQVSVASVEAVTPAMVRIVVEGDELAGFTSLSPDDHVKLIVGDERRDYTPRRFDKVGNRLTLDFAVHDAGPATAWALSAKVGDPVVIGGPRGSVVVPADFDWWFLIGDETALPAIGRRIEELPAGAAVLSLVAVTGPEEEQRFETAAEHRALWVHRPASEAADPAPLLAALAGLSLPPGEGFVWIAAEAMVVRAARAHVLEQMGHPLAWLKASGYWVKGKADTTEKFDG